MPVKRFDYAKIIQLILAIITIVLLLLNFFMGKRNAEYQALCDRVDKLEKNYTRLDSKFDKIYEILIEIKDGKK